jgi:hypothetical protein
MMNLIDNNQMSLASIVFSDQSTFILHGEVNRHNWDDRNAHWIRETHTQFPQKVNVWAGIISD